MTVEYFQLLLLVKYAKIRFLNNISFSVELLTRLSLKATIHNVGLLYALRFSQVANPVSHLWHVDSVPKSRTHNHLNRSKFVSRNKNQCELNDESKPRIEQQRLRIRRVRPTDKQKTTMKNDKQNLQHAFRRRGTRAQFVASFRTARIHARHAMDDAFALRLTNCYCCCCTRCCCSSLRDSSCCCCSCCCQPELLLLFK